LALIGALAHRRMKSEAVEFGTHVRRRGFVWARWIGGLRKRLSRL
jgi:hypothetical protein